VEVQDVFFGDNTPNGLLKLLTGQELAECEYDDPPAAICGPVEARDRSD
jgi:hypothetical protein